MDESMEEEPFPEQEGASVEGRSQDVRNEARKNAGSNQHRPGPLRPVKGPGPYGGETVVVTRKVDPERGKSTVNGENRMLVEVVDPEPLSGDHVPFQKETGKSEFMEGERGVVEKGRQCQSKEAFSVDSVVIIEKGGQCFPFSTTTPLSPSLNSLFPVSFRNGTWSPVRGSGSTTSMSV